MSRQSKRGQSLVEFALLIPMVLILLLGFFDLGRALVYYSTLSNAVREGTRKGIVSHDNLSEIVNGSDVTQLPCALVEPATLDADTVRCSVFRKIFGLSKTLNPTVFPQNNILPVVTTDSETGMYETVRVTANYCFVPITPGITLIVNTMCDGKKGILLTATSKMYVAPAAR